MAGEYVEVSVTDLRKGDIFDLAYQVVRKRRQPDLGLIRVTFDVIDGRGNVTARHSRAYYPSDTVTVRKES